MATPYLYNPRHSMADTETAREENNLHQLYAWAPPLSGI